MYYSNGASIATSAAEDLFTPRSARSAYTITGSSWEGPPGPMGHASRELRNARNELVTALRMNTLSLRSAALELRKDRESILTSVRLNGWALQNPTGDVRTDRSFLLEAMRLCGHAFEFCMREMSRDRHVVIEAVHLSGRALEHAPKELRRDRDFIVSVVRSNCKALKHFVLELEADRSVMLETVRQNGLSLRQRTGQLKMDQDFCQLAVLISRSAMDYASDVSRIAEVATTLRSLLELAFQDQEAGDKNKKADSLQSLGSQLLQEQRSDWVKDPEGLTCLSAR